MTLHQISVLVELGTIWDTWDRHSSSVYSKQPTYHAITPASSQIHSTYLKMSHFPGPSFFSHLYNLYFTLALITSSFVSNKALFFLPHQRFLPWRSLSYLYFANTYNNLRVQTK